MHSSQPARKARGALPPRRGRSRNVGLLLGAAALLSVVLGSRRTVHAAPIYITFVWHMHQPIYWPGETVVETTNAGHYSFDVATVHTDRSGPYTSWPSDAIGAARAAGLMDCGTQVSLTGSLMENLDALESAGWGFSGWRDPWNDSTAWTTDSGNPSIDLVGFGYFHPLSALIGEKELVTQIEMHREALTRRFPGRLVSKGMFPPETAFSERMIPALLEAGVEWIVVDNIHFDRTLADYPYSSGSNLFPPNEADVRSDASPSWVQLNGIWAPTPVSAPWGYQPHWAEYIDPETGESRRIIVVPGARYEGNEDARGGFGALNYEEVLSQLEPYNTDPDHPILMVLHHDGDNYGGGTDSYYHSNFNGFISWLQANPDRFKCTTIQEYLDEFPPDPDDVIHVEDGSWSGADNGDPEFLKWNGDPAGDGYSPDRHSWAVITAARNRLLTATAASGDPTVEEILDGTTALGRAWRWFLMGQTSCYWYWDNSENGIWDSHPSRASNGANGEVESILSGLGAESVPPSIYPPQREPYNPGALEWGPDPETSDLTVWTFAYDVSDLVRVELKYRYDNDGVMTHENHLYHGSTWCTHDMTESTPESRTDPLPTHLAHRYSATLTELEGYLIDYYIEAEDTHGNVARSEIRHVWVEGGGTGPGPSGVSHYPESPNVHDVITVKAYDPGFVHWGINGWNEPPSEYWPGGTTSWGDGHAVETPLEGPGFDGRYTAVLGPFDGAASVDEVDFIIHYADDSWSGSDIFLSLAPSPGDTPRVSVEEPPNGAAVSGTIRLIATAADDNSVPSVTYSLDGNALETLSERPYELSLDTSTLSLGAHTVTVTAEDGDGHTAQDSVEFQTGGGTGPEECVVGGELPDGGIPTGDGGSPQGDGGSPPEGDGGASTTGGGGGSGCGCRQASGAPSTPWGGPLLILLILGLGAALSRKRRP